MTTPRLEQEFRYDVNFSQAKPGAKYTENFGNTKGLELIPFENVEIIAGVPGYVVHNNPAVLDGWGDFQLLLKYRLLSANEQHGNYILTAFVSETFPTGTNKNGQLKSVVTPTLAYGKGWGDFDMQGTVAATEPRGADVGDRPIVHVESHFPGARSHEGVAGARAQSDVVLGRQE